jgi:ABC-2 type transport system ATP-binding protein
LAEHRVARSVAALAIVTLACVSVPRLRLEYAPDVSFPELAVSLSLPAANNVDVAATTRQFVVPIESALRAVGDTTGTRGDVSAGSARITARFKRGTDIDLKAARLASELAPLRARLPAHASLGIFPAQGGVRSNFDFAITGRNAADAAQRLAEELRSTPGVREVRTFGTRRRQIDVRSDLQLDPSTIIGGLQPEPIGDVRSGSRRVDVIGEPAYANVRDAARGADIRPRWEEASSIAKLDGRAAVIVSVFRDEETPLLTFDRAVRALTRGRVTIIWSDADELRAILLRLLLGAAIAAIVLWLAGGFRLALYIPLAIAIVVNAWSIAALRIDAQTLLASAIAIAALAPFAATRSKLAIGATFVLLPPIAVAFGTGDLAPLLMPAAWDFSIAGLCALLAAFLVDAPHPRFAHLLPASGEKGYMGRRPGEGLHAPHAVLHLRNAASVVLACFTVAVFLLSWFGERLDPRRTQGSSDRKRVFVRMQMPSGTTLEQTGRAAASIESALQNVAGVERFWTYAMAGSATVVVEVKPEIEQPRRFDLFRSELRSRFPATAGTFAIESSSERGNVASLAESIEEQPYADESGSTYRFLLKGTDPESLRSSLDEVTTRLVRAGHSRRSILSEWPAASPRIELVPNRDVDPAVADALAVQLARRSLPPQSEEMPDGTVVRVVDRDAPEDQNVVPQKSDLFTRVLRVGERTFVAAAVFTPQMAMTEGSVTRELGRFVMPVNVAINGYSIEQRVAGRAEVDRSIALAPLPAGVIAERPQLESWRFSRAKFRLASMAAFLPLLIFTAALIALGSFSRAAIALIPSAFGVAIVAPALTSLMARLDEMTLLAAGSAVCCVAALSVVELLRINGPTVARTYRSSRAHMMPVLIAAASGFIFLAMAASARTAIGDAWRAPLVAAAAVVVAGVPASLVLPGSLDVILRDIARRRTAAARAFADPAVWRDDTAPLHVSVQNLTKVYRSGHRALHRVSFELQPGVVGLLGPNGAGKTTLLRIMTGLLQPTRGVVAYRGVPVRAENVARFRRAIGFLPQEFNAYAGLTAAQFLDFWALERGIDDPRRRREEIEGLLAVVGLDEHANRRVREFSGGMRQRIGIARALLGDPPILVVDEPTTGLDIEARRRFRDLLIALARNRIIVLSSHIASDVETTAMHLLLLSKGSLRWQGSVDALLARAEGRVFEATVSDADVRDMARQFRLTARVRIASGIRVRGVVADGQSLPGAAVRPTLEEAYLSEVSTGVLRTGSFAFVFSNDER